jgi:actin-related protein 8
MKNRRGAQVIVLHPGSRFFRIGKATDVTPVAVPCVVARKCKPPVPAVTRVEGIVRPRADADDPVCAPSFPYGLHLIHSDPFFSLRKNFLQSLHLSGIECDFTSFG